MITVAVPHQDVADALGDLGDARTVVWNPAEQDAPAEVRESVALACLPHWTGGRTVYGRLADCPSLRVIQIAAAGFDHALPFVPDGVALANARGVHDTRVAEMTLALVLASRRRLPAFFEAQRAGVWSPDFDAPSLADSRALIVGYGSIARAIAHRLRACEVTVEGVARTGRRDSDGTLVHPVSRLAEVVREADVVIVVVPASESTHHLIDDAVLSAMGDGALLVNVGRGSAVDTEALLAHLERGRLTAALDVTDPEPLPQGHPLWRAPGCIIVPHVAGVERLTNRRYTSLVHRQIAALRAGLPPVNLVAVGPVPVRT